MKFLIVIEMDGYDTEEDANAACTEESVAEALSDYGFTVIKVERK
jgi:hypothetical protein